MRSMKAKVAVFFAAAMFTFALTQEVYRRNIESLHDSLYKAIDSLEEVHITESFHSAMHTMLMSSSEFAKTGEPRYVEQYAAARSEGDNAIRNPILFRGTDSDSPHEHSMKSDARKRIESDMQTRFAVYKETLDKVFNKGALDSQELIARGSSQFDDVFSDYYKDIHSSHYGSLQKIRDDAHTIYTQSRYIYVIQLVLAIGVGVFLLVFADRVFLKIFRSVETDSVTDALTGLHNRRQLERTILQELEAVEQQGGLYSLALLDIDHFKNFNDSYGHAAGDKLLADLAGVLTRTVRKTDRIVRYGGEEFLLVLPNSNPTDAASIAEKVRKAVEVMTFVLPDGNLSYPVTASIGVSSHPEEGADFKKLLQLADERLYRAKAQGRNRVCS